MAEAIKTLYDYVPQYLKADNLSEYINDDLWVKLRTHILDYDALVADAEKHVDELTACPSGDYGPEVVECPRCGNTTLVVGGNDGRDYCYYVVEPCRWINVLCAGDTARKRCWKKSSNVLIVWRISQKK
jgi:hypothetical protein